MEDIRRFPSPPTSVAFSPNGPRVISNSGGNLANVLHTRFGQTARIEETLAGKEKAWGCEHASTLDTINNLGDAEGMYNNALVRKDMHQPTLFDEPSLRALISTLDVPSRCFMEAAADRARQKVVVTSIIISVNDMRISMGPLRWG